MENEIICVIPCRAGSVRLPHKNIKELCGKPLWEWTVLQAISIKALDTIYITTDSKEIIEGCQKYEEQDIRVKVIIRPEYLATEDTPMYAVVEHCCQRERDDAVILLLQVTSPLRTSEDISNCLLIFDCFDIGIVSTTWSYPSHKMRINGAIYMHYLGTIRNTKSFIQKITLNYIMSPERSVDIDTYEDFKDAEFMMEKRLKKND